MENIMRPVMMRVPFVLLLAIALGVSSPRTDHQTVVAQQRAGMVVTRIFTGPDGETHAEEITVKLARSDVSTEVSEMTKATGVQFRRQAPSYVEDWHTAPRKQYVITLSGRGEIELSDGKRIPLGPGHILLVEDLTGKGTSLEGWGLRIASQYLSRLLSSSPARISTSSRRFDHESSRSIARERSHVSPLLPAALLTTAAAPPLLWCRCKVSFRVRRHSWYPTDSKRKSV